MLAQLKSAIAPKAQSFMLKPQTLQVKGWAIAPKAQSFKLQAQQLQVKGRAIAF